MSELKIFKDMEANCANCPFDITEGDIKRCYDDCGDKPNECYECSYLEYYLKSEADKVIAEKDKEIAELKARIHELENMPHTDNSAVIDALETENEALKKELAELREATRWRDVEKEPPEIKEESEEVAVLVEYENNYSRGVFVTHSDFYKGVFYETHLDNEINRDDDNDGERCYQKVIKWQPMPKAPEADK